MIAQKKDGMELNVETTHTDLVYHETETFYELCVN